MENLLYKFVRVLGKIQDVFSIALGLLLGPVFFWDGEDE